MSACASHPLGIGREQRITPIPNGRGMLERVRTLQQGMSEDAVFKALEVTRNSPNVGWLDIEAVFQHVSLLHVRNGTEKQCADTTVSLPYYGYRFYDTNVRSEGYFSNAYTWTRRDHGKNLQVDTLFWCGELLSVAQSGDPEVDKRTYTYPWSILSNPWNTIPGMTQ